MCLRIPIVSALLLLFLAGGLSAQSPLFTQYKFHRLDERHGLTNNVVSDILQDSLGQVWVSTHEGLYRYQGFGFQRYVRHQQTTDYLHNNFVERLFLDRDNQVWVMTDDGVSYYSYAVDVMQRYLPDKLSGRVTSMAVDESGTHYFGKHDGGVVTVRHDSLSTLDLYDSSTGMDLGVHSIDDLFIRDDCLWAIVGEIGVMRYDLRTRSITFFSAAEINGHDRLTMFELQAQDGAHSWIGTGAGVFRLEIGTNGEKTVDRRLNLLLPEDDYLSVHTRGDEELWIGSRSNGMYRIAVDPEEGYRLERHFSPSNDEYGLSNRTVSKVYAQADGYVWVGTHNGGVNVFDPAGERVRTITKRTADTLRSLSYESVWGIEESADGTLWVGTDGRGVSRLDPATGNLRNNVIPALGDRAILALKETADHLWVGTYANGVYRYDRKTGGLRQYAVGSPGSELSVNDIRCFYEDGMGTLYIGTNRGGIYRYRAADDRVERLVEVPNLDIRAIASVNGGVLWLGTFEGGVKKYHVEQRRLVNSPWSDHVSHRRDVVQDMSERDGVLWVATRHNGVVVFDTRTGRFVEEEALKEMANRSVTGLEMDDRDNLWITALGAVFHYDRSTGRVRTFEAKDGFQSSHYNFGSVLYSERGGYLAVGGIRGLNLFKPAELLAGAPPKGLVLNQVKVYDTVVNPLNSDLFPAGESIFLTDRLDLNYTDNIFSIRYSVPGFTNRDPHNFEYRLEGYEQEWQSGTESALATYRNVPPGDYTFRARAGAGDPETRLSVSIRPPFWKTWPAYLLYLTLLLLVLWRLNRFSNSRLALKQKLQFEQEMREKEQAITQEKLRFYTNFSHELKTPLTLIRGPVNDLLHATEDPDRRRTLLLIRKNTDIILKFIGRMLQFRKIELNKTTLNAGRHDLYILASETAERFRFLAEEREIRFGFFCENGLYAWVDQDQLQIVINNLLSNALKFTPRGRAVTFGLRQEEDDISIVVRDEGVGIREDELGSIFLPYFQASNSAATGGTGIGLALCKSFVELHLGTIDVESEVGKGTTFTVTLPRGKSRFEGLEYVRFVEAAEGETAGGGAQVPGNSSEALADSGNERVMLVVDDNEDICAYVSNLFASEFRVLTAHDGAAGYELATANAPDIIISDMMMPGMNGFEFCERIKTNLATSHIPVIMLTARDSKQDQISGYEVGADDYITKPFVSELLRVRVRSLLKNRARLRLRRESVDLIDPQSQEHPREIAFLRRAETSILELLDQSSFTVPDLCRELGMSQSVLYRKIKSLTGVSIQVFAKKVRLKSAARQLQETDRRVSEIAYGLEFSDLKYFRKCFREQFDMSPSAYRKRKPADSKSAITPWLLLVCLLAACTDGEKPAFNLLPAAETGIDFTNEIVEDGTHNIMTYQYMYNGAGVALGDLDGDGTTDVFLVGNTVPNALYLNRGDWNFEDVTAAAGLRGREGGWRTGVTLADFDGDGLLDIYLCYSGNVAGEGMEAPVQRDRPERANELYINEGPGPDGVPVFTERAAEYGLEATGTFSSQAYVLDYDRDGDLDLFLVNHANMFYSPFFNTSTLRSKRHPYFGNRLYRNDGARFADVSEAAGIHGSGLNYGLSASITDFDGDGWPDLFVTNDYDEQDFLYLNQRDGSFREVSHGAFAHLSKFSMGSDVADVNNDGRPDLFVADMLPEDNRRQKLLRGPDKYDKYQLAVDSGFHQQNMRNMLQLNLGPGPDSLPRFREVGQLAGLAATDWSWATLFADFDNDAHLDLYITNGYLRDYTNMDFLRYAQDRMGRVISSSRESSEGLMELIREMPETKLANYLFTGSDSLVFTDRTDSWQLDETSISNGAAYGDLDGDGDLDLVVNNLNQPAFVYRNGLDDTSRHYLRIRLEGEAPNTFGIGAVAEATVGETTLRREAYYVRGYQSSVEPVLTFGLGTADRVDALRITWPDGNVSELTDVAADRLITVRRADAGSVATGTPTAEERTFSSVGEVRGIDFVHRENDFIDFKVQRLIPYQPSRLGGMTAAGDANGDGRDDIYFGGALGQAGSLFLSTGSEGYRSATPGTWEADAQYEDLGSTFFDADGDGDLDLYVVSGGNEHPPLSPEYQDRLYLNDGRGNFRRAEGALPTGEPGSGGRVVAADYDRDGDVDLFVAGRVEPQFYPLPPRSRLLRNESGPAGVRFVDATPEVAPALARAGMVTDATWTDPNGDGWADLMLVGEWMPVKLFLNDGNGGFNDATESYGLSDSFGWWSAVTATDVDGDGDTDYLLGNAGTNHRYTASPEEPMEYFVQDLNGDQDPDPIMTYYIQGKRYPVPSYDEMADQMASFRKHFGDYASYADAGIEQVLETGAGGQSFNFRINELRSGWLERSGDTFTFHPLPRAAQVSVVNSFTVADFDGDGQREILALGNFYPYRVEWGPADALLGALFEFRSGAVAQQATPYPLPFAGDVRDARLLDAETDSPTLLVTRNDGTAELYSFGRRGRASK